MDQQNASAQRLLPAAMLKRWLQVCRVKITFGLFPMNRFVTTTWRKNSVKCLRKLESRFYWESALVRELPNPHRYAYYVNLNVMSTLMIDTIRIYMYIFAKLGHYAWRDISLEPFLWSGSLFLQDPLFPWLWAYICPPSRLSIIHVCMWIVYVYVRTSSMCICIYVYMYTQTQMRARTRTHMHTHR